MSAKFPKKIYAEICKEHADQLYKVKNRPDLAL